MPPTFPERVLQCKEYYNSNHIRTYREALQLILRVDATFENGSVEPIWVLIDTGAEANLIRRGLVPDHLTFPAKKVLNLFAANGQSIRGGTRTAKLSFGLTQFVDGIKLDEKLPLSAEFWEADIETDAMLSYPWMVENQIGFFPHLKALAKDFPKLTLLFVKGKHMGAVLATEDEDEEEEISVTPSPKAKPKRRKNARYKTKNTRKNVRIRNVQFQKVEGMPQGLEPTLWNHLQGMNLKLPHLGQIMF